MSKNRSKKISYFSEKEIIVYLREVKIGWCESLLKETSVEWSMTGYSRGIQSTCIYI